MLDLLIQNARYYFDGAFLQGHIAIKDGKIVSISAPQGDIPLEEVCRTIDAAGKYVLPGLVDSHVHSRDPGRTDREDFFTLSQAAVAGGVTLVCDMPNTPPPVYAVDILQERIENAASKCMMDFAFYAAAGYENRLQLQDLYDAGACAFKTFLQPPLAGREKEFQGITVSDDGQLYMLLQQAGQVDARFCFHCENHSVIQIMEEYLKSIGALDNAFHYRSRPDVAEVEAVSTVIQFAKATCAKVGICHITVPAACQLVKEAKAQGVDITSETCFHYLLFDNSALDEYGAYAKCNPPLRSREDMLGLWPYVLDGTIDFLGSDHAPFIPEEKAVEAWKAFSGLPGMEVMLPLMLTQVNEGKLSLELLARFMSENVCRTFGFYPQKGVIQTGADADLTIIDLEAEHRLDIAQMYTKAKAINRLFDGIPCKGKPVYTISRGRVLFENGQVHTEFKGTGKLVRPRG